MDRTAYSSQLKLISEKITNNSDVNNLQNYCEHHSVVKASTILEKRHRNSYLDMQVYTSSHKWIIISSIWAHKNSVSKLSIIKSNPPRDQESVSTSPPTH